jgi:predicted dehydrogenase
MVGVGGFGGHRRMLMRQTGLFRIVAAWDHSPEALAKACAEENARPARSYEDLLDEPGLEAIIISTGASAHADQAVAAAERGLHVFVEKPVCCNAGEAARLREVQRRTKVVMASGHHDHRSEAISRTIKRLADDGTLGKVAAVEAVTAHSGGLVIKPGDWRGEAGRNPGGMLFQCGVHKLHELMFYFGPIARVSARMRYDVHATATADAAFCHLEFASGLIGSLNAYHVTPYCHRMSIFGTNATLYREDRFFDEGTTLRLQRRAPEGSNAKERLEAVPVLEKDGPDGALRRFAEAVRTGSEPYPSLEDGLRAVEVVFAAEQSAREGRVIDITR